MPLATLLDLDGPPGEVAGFGPVDAGTTRALAAAAARHPATRWCVTVTDEAGRVIGHGCRRREHAPAGGAPPGDGPPGDGPPGGGHRSDAPCVGTPCGGAAGGGAAGGGAACGDGAPGGRALLIKIDPLAVGCCAHDRETAGYQLTPRLRHLIEIRDRTCTFPGCRRPATRCDKDHTLAYDQGGRTCECNISPLCRAHHKVKQAQGWHLEQPAPGVLVWTTPAGRKYTTGTV